MAAFSDSVATTPAARVLVVDDDKTFLAVLTDTLREGGHHVDATTDAQDALRRAEGGAYDVALLDLVMPAMTGLELGDRVKAASPDTEVLILTGHADLDAAIEGIKHRVFDFLEKTGLDMARLDRVIKAATDFTTQISLIDNRLELPLNPAAPLFAFKFTASGAAIRANPPSRG